MSLTDMLDTQKALALDSLQPGTFVIRIRRSGEWYATIGPDRQISECMVQGVHGSGSTPEEALENLWEEATRGNPPPVLVIRDPEGGRSRRTVSWNGFMWEDSKWIDA